MFFRKANKSPLSVIEKKILETKAALTPIYVDRRLNKLSNDSPFVAFGFSSEQIDSFPPEWRKEVRKIWLKHSKKTKQFLSFVDSLSKELSDFLKDVENIKL